MGPACSLNLLCDNVAKRGRVDIKLKGGGGVQGMYGCASPVFGFCMFFCLGFFSDTLSLASSPNPPPEFENFHTLVSLSPTRMQARGCLCVCV